MKDSHDDGVRKQEGEDGEGLFRSLLEAAPDGMVIADERGTIVLVNGEAERMFGYPRAELIGQKVEVLVPQQFRGHHEAQREGYIHDPRTRPMGIGMELSGRRKDGTEFPVEISLSPLKTAQGVLVSAAVRDVTERRRIQQALRESEQRFRVLVHGVKDYAIYMLDPEGRVMNWTEAAEATTGYQTEEIVGQDFSRFFTPEDRERGKPAEALRGAAEAGRWEEESWRVRKDGSRLYVSTVLTALHDEQGRLTGFATVTRDITERKRVEEMKRKEEQMAEALRREVLLRREIHHRVKNSLQIVSSLLFLHAQSIGDPRLEEILNESRSRVTSIALIHEKLYRAGNATKIDFADYIQDLVRDVFQALRINRAMIAPRIETQPVLVGVDVAVPCGLIVTELVSNALRHAFPGARTGEVAVELHPNGHDTLTLRVSDNGQGMPKDFDWQHTRTLGLQLVNDLARQLDGNIKFESGPGTAVTITFPQPPDAEGGKS
ncbi:MAG: PAS domain S-box protein [Verrucomicrobia bacterium]|nr:PAS domain S-box protein [Verrucomicrobiota bacterium]